MPPFRSTGPVPCVRPLELSPDESRLLLLPPSLLVKYPLSVSVSVSASSSTTAVSTSLLESSLTAGNVCKILCAAPLRRYKKRRYKKSPVRGGDAAAAGRMFRFHLVCVYRRDRGSPPPPKRTPPLPFRPKSMSTRFPPRSRSTLGRKKRENNEGRRSPPGVVLSGTRIPFPERWCCPFFKSIFYGVAKLWKHDDLGISFSDLHASANTEKTPVGGPYFEIVEQTPWGRLPHRVPVQGNSINAPPGVVEFPRGRGDFGNKKDPHLGGKTPVLTFLVHNTILCSMVDHVALAAVYALLLHAQ